MQIIDSTPAALSANLQMYLRNGDVFFDIETTGLSWRTSHLYLIGALFFDPAADAFTLRQWFLDRPTEEKEMLVSFFTFLSDVKQLLARARLRLQDINSLPHTQSTVLSDGRSAFVNRIPGSLSGTPPVSVNPGTFFNETEKCGTVSLIPTEGST